MKRAAGGLKSKVRVGIWGGAGYTGGDLLRILLDHPRAEVNAVSSGTYPGEPVYRAHPNLQGRTELKFVSELDPAELDCLFFAGAHGEAMRALPAFLDRAGKELRLIDLSGDFRLKDAGQYPIWYGREHAAPALLESFVYGLTELNRANVAKAKRIANPGCFATALALALAPLAKFGARGAARVTAITGSTGSGTKPGPRTHHATREGSIQAYAPLRHQHVPEVQQLLKSLAGPGSLEIALVPVSGPLVRGIYAICHVDRPAGLQAAAVPGLFRKMYAGCPFIRLHDSPPALNAVTGSNYCDLHAAVEGDRIAVIASLDNLVKGASGQAVQNFNVMLGFGEAEGLGFSGVYP